MDLPEIKPHISRPSRMLGKHTKFKCPELALEGPRIPSSNIFPAETRGFAALTRCFVGA